MVSFLKEVREAIFRCVKTVLAECPNHDTLQVVTLTLYSAKSGEIAIDPKRARFESSFCSRQNTEMYSPVAQRYHVTSDTLGREFDPDKRDFSHLETKK